MIAGALILLGFLPLADWIPGGRADPAYAARWSEWGYGTSICLGIAIVAVIFARRRRARTEGSQRETEDADSTADASGRSPESLAFLALAFVLAFALYALVARSVFSARPLLIDEVVQVFQAHIFAAGRLALPVAPHREFFSALHVVDLTDKVFSQFPAGWPAMLAIAVRFGAPWLAGPFCGAVAVVLFARLVRLLEPTASRSFVRGTTLLFAVTPFGVFQFASHMNHGPALMWILLAMVCLGEHMRSGSRSQVFVAGLAFGAAATLRPLDAFAFALPAGTWLSWRALLAWRQARRWDETIALLMSGLGIAVPMAALFYVNARTTGSATLFGYEMLWGRDHGLGFHAAPWGAAHTPARGIELVSLYVTRLQTYLFETPFPSLLPAIAALALTRRLRALDRYLLVSSAFLGALYFAYWHDGFFLGPRFVVAWLPALVVWTARFPSLALFAPIGRLEHWRDGHRRDVRTAVVAFLASGIVMASAFSLPIRVAQYHGGLQSMRTDYASAAKTAGVRDALVFVRESWGAQLIARMWGVGVSRAASEAFYAKVDACALDEEIDRIEREDVRGAAAEARLRPLLRDSAQVRGTQLSPDSTEKYRPGAPYDAVCVERINEDRAGYMHYAPLLLENANDNVYGRDLHGRDSLLLAEYPGRPVYLLRHHGTNVESPLEWIPLRRDSLLAAWRSASR
ncbi:MAG: hypothetical protein HYR75_00550 [Gemmatimonadetes bacterium]|nr:hypothetical protein [Gemmatimonadota bacterium]MBI3504576.1 hypothetical protein [Pseudomonadota bacterium]